MLSRRQACLSLHICSGEQSWRSTSLAGCWLPSCVRSQLLCLASSSNLSPTGHIPWSQALPDCLGALLVTPRCSVFTDRPSVLSSCVALGRGMELLLEEGSFLFLYPKSEPVAGAGIMDTSSGTPGWALPAAFPPSGLGLFFGTMFYVQAAGQGCQSGLASLHQQHPSSYTQHALLLPCPACMRTRSSWEARP